MKYLNYDQTSGQVTDKSGTLITTYIGATPVEIEKSSTVDDIIKLKNAGFTAEDIIAIKKANLDK